MDDDQFFLGLMRSLDAAFLAQQGSGAWNPEGWGERFFQALSLSHSQWAVHMHPVYMKACEILNYFAFLRRAEDMGRAFYEKPEALLRMVLVLLNGGRRDGLAGDTKEPQTVEHGAETQGG